MATLLELLRAKKQEMASGNRMKTIKPQPGTGRYRILPSWRGEGQQFWHDYGQHYIKDMNMKMSAVYICADKTFGKPCQVCDAIRSGIASADDATKDILKEGNAGQRVLLNVLHLDGPTPGEVQILELAPTAFGALVDIAALHEEEGEPIFEIGRGKDILISRTGTGLQTKYTMMTAVKTTPVPDGVMTKLHNLDDYVKQESEGQQLRALNSVRAVSGLIDYAPSTSGLPSAVAALGAARIEEDPYAPAPAPAPAAKRAAPVAEVEDIEAKPAVRVKPEAPAPVMTADSGDDELDQMLAAMK
jgi:hypothetical protein